MDRNNGNYMESDSQGYFEDNDQQSLDSLVEGTFKEPYSKMYNFRPLVAFNVPTKSVLPNGLNYKPVLLLFTFENSRQDLYLASKAERAANNIYNADGWLICPTDSVLDRQMRLGVISTREVFMKANRIDEVYTTPIAPIINYTPNKDKEPNLLPTMRITDNLAVKVDGDILFNSVSKQVITADNYDSKYYTEFL
jgi:hypothetical protein